MMLNDMLAIRLRGVGILLRLLLLLQLLEGNSIGERDVLGSKVGQVGVAGAGTGAFSRGTALVAAAAANVVLPPLPLMLLLL